MATRISIVTNRRDMTAMKFDFNRFENPKVLSLRDFIFRTFRHTTLSSLSALFRDEERDKNSVRHFWCHLVIRLKQRDKSLIRLVKR